MLGALILLLLTKEHYGISVAGFGFLWGWHHKDWKRGGSVIAGGLAATYVVMGVIMPLFHGGTHPMLSGDGTVVSRYGWLFAPWPEKISTFLMIMIGDGTAHITGLLHLLLLLLSGLMFPLIAPFYLAPASADLLANVLSTNPMPRHNASYHAASCIPIVIIAAVQGYKWLEAKRPTSRSLLAATALAMAATLPMSGLMQYPLLIWELNTLTLTRDKKVLHDVSALLGEEPVVAQANIGMFFSQRSAIYPFPNMLDKSNLVVLHVFQPFSDPDRPHFNIPYGMSTQAFTETLSGFMREENWHIAYWQKPWLVMKRGDAKQDETESRAEITQAIAEMRLVRVR
jgi:Predicted membrane protein (DUF2079)